MDATETRSVLAADPDEVWEVLTSPDGVESWLGEGSSLPPVEGAELDVADVETGVRRLGRVETVEPGRRLGFVWWPADDGDEPEGTSRVEVVLSPVDGGTRLVITEAPLAPTRASASIDASMSASVSGTDAVDWAWRGAALELAVVGRRVGSGLVVVC